MIRKTAFCLCACFVFAACDGTGVFSAGGAGLKDGYYAAEMAGADRFGWKEFLSITINDGRIAAVEYDAKNSSGFIKSWDPDYMRLMNAAKGVYPNKYARTYANALVLLQDPARIDAISGASLSHRTFVLLAEAALAQARTGAREVVFIRP